MKYDITTPSQYNAALVERLRAKIDNSIAVESYDEFGRVEIKQPTIFIQWEDGHPGIRQNDGRYNHQFMITAHCVIPKAIPNAYLHALDLASEVERLLERRTLFKAPADKPGLPDVLLVHAEQVGMPQIQVNGDTSFLLGLDAVESRGVQWLQPLYLGPSLNGEPEIRGVISVAINAKNPDDLSEYQVVTPHD